MMSKKEILNNKKNEAATKSYEEITKKVAIATVIGVGIGVVLGVLFAPKSGKELRHDISEIAKDTTETVKNTSRTVKENVKSSAHDLKGKQERIYINIKDSVSKIKNDEIDDI